MEIEKPKKGYEFKGVKEYWEERYAQGGHSGSGSLGRLGEFKAEVVNNFCQEHKIKTVIEWGCGDGNQLSLMKYPSYFGLDISPSAVDLCRNRFRDDRSKQFAVLPPPRAVRRHDLAVSLDVIYHLVNDELYYQYLENLFRFSKRFVCIYAKDENSEQGGYYNHMRFRKFTADIARLFPGWHLYRHVPNRYPYDINDINNTSPSDFYFFRRNGAIITFLTKIRKIF